jgi:hypothetical protein
MDHGQDALPGFRLFRQFERVVADFLERGGVRLGVVVLLHRVFLRYGVFE